MQLRGPLVGPDRWWYHTLLKGTVRETLASYGSVPESGPPFPLTNGSSNQPVLPFYFSVSGFFLFLFSFID
ncbi:hypothetical protein HanIR_MTg0918221 (mitochondrion) [Helianthus annuus]|nr:hypothetical protein HanIR_MTg0918221 [Helianthus annuus]